MVYTANGGFISTIVVAPRFGSLERQSLEPMPACPRFGLVTTRHVNEGQGDLLMVGEAAQTTARNNAEIAAVLGPPVVSLELVRPTVHHPTSLRWPPTITSIAHHRRRSVRQRLSALGSSTRSVVGSADAPVRTQRRLVWNVVLPVAAMGLRRSYAQPG